MCRRSIVTGVVLGCVLATLAGGPSRAADWPQWRGPERDGKLAEFVAPESWPDELKQVWKREVGTGHSSPVVVGDRGFVFCREEENEVVRAVNLADGREQWSQSYPAPYEMNRAARSHGKGPKSTPVVADGRVFTLGISGILSCWDAGSGERVWQHEFSGQFKKTSPLFGTAMSPVVEAGLLIAHVGGHDGGALTAFDPQTGQVRWQWAEDGPAYTSPMVTTLAGTRQVITQSQQACLGVSPADGSLLWKFPFETQYVMNIVTPVLLGDVVVISGYRKGTTAYRLRKEDGRWSPEEVWHNGDLSMFMSSPVLVGKRLFGFAQEDKGKLFCLDPATGAALWTSEGRMGENAALVAAGDVLLALTSNAELIVFKTDAERFEPVARYRVADTPTWAHPVVVGNRVLIKDKDSLALWAIGG
ncbi:MAG TPA: PQQ-binding-like beta-propeller repeat protein [Thermoguttaceae bacterium]|nr:PQQ-binding-like beta-propeller repeat protein [Thermoguttaceae bacterium]